MLRKKDGKKPENVRFRFAPRSEPEAQGEAPHLIPLDETKKSGTTSDVLERYLILADKLLGGDKRLHKAAKTGAS